MGWGKNYGGFDRITWISRDNESQREECNMLQNCTSKSERESHERDFGTRYSVLLELVYFDPIRMTALDPMHNLFLGTAKHMMSVWKTKKLLCDEDFKLIQENMEPFECPSDIDRLPKKFLHHMGHLMQISIRIGHYYFQFMLFMICYHWNILTVGENLF